MRMQSSQQTLKHSNYMGEKVDKIIRITKGDKNEWEEKEQKMMKKCLYILRAVDTTTVKPCRLYTTSLQRNLRRRKGGKRDTQREAEFHGNMDIDGTRRGKSI